MTSFTHPDVTTGFRSSASLSKPNTPPASSTDWFESPIITIPDTSHHPPPFHPRTVSTEHVSHPHPPTNLASFVDRTGAATLIHHYPLPNDLLTLPSNDHSRSACRLDCFPTIYLTQFFLSVFSFDFVEFVFV
ncbi:hypothetical protein BLNAU_6013 [Blattamonas nauphoetae]|uniref:Uncharacterized protein n=1 Tax=Blattamonas nauphoetae TaxID=2049346 RepID=A0ABQ9Y5H3_9EUKA|nr:hypothetical protein BLNAU_6013 [Blattamonas nauphoetae]